MNAIAVNLKNGKVVDPFGGRKDIRKKLIRTVGNPHERFMEDGLRPIRALRFASKLNFGIEKYTFSEIFKEDVQKKIVSISMERFRDEFEKILLSKKPSVGLKLMEQTGILNLFIPEFTVCRGCIQSDYRAFHSFDVLDHLFYACDGAVPVLHIRLAALFHDIGKPVVKKIITESVLDGEKTDGSKKEIQTLTFYGHENEGAKITKQILIRLKFSNEITNKVCHLVKEHMFHYESNWTDAAVHRFIVRVGYENLDDLYDLRLSDMYGMKNVPVDMKNNESINLLLELKQRVENVMQKNNALSLKQLAVNGRDLMQNGIPSGKILGEILNQLMECVLEDPSMNDREKLLSVAKKLYDN